MPSKKKPRSPSRKTTTGRGRASRGSTAVSASPPEVAEALRPTPSAWPLKSLQLDNLRNTRRLTLGEFTWVLSQIPVLRAWAASVEAEALTRLTRGEKLPGFKLVRGRANRTWSDTATVITGLNKLGIPMDVYLPRYLVSPAVIQKFVQKAKQSAQWGTIKSWILQPLGKPAIVSETDPRPEYLPGSEFDNVNDNLESELL